MRKGELSKLVSVASRILLAFLFVFSQSAWAGQDPIAKDLAKDLQSAALQTQHHQCCFLAGALRHALHLRDSRFLNCAGYGRSTAGLLDQKTEARVPNRMLYATL
jgi:hypothetical protein